MKITLFVVVCVSFAFLAGCSSGPGVRLGRLPEVDVSEAGSSRRFLSVDDALFAVGVPRKSLEFGQVGPVAIGPAAVCDVAQLVVVDTLSLGLSCAAVGSASVAWSGGPGGDLLAAFVTLLREISVDVAFVDGGVVLSGGSDAGSASVVPSSFAAQVGADAVLGSASVVEGDALSAESVQAVTEFSVGGVARPLPGGVGLVDALAVAAEYGLRVSSFSAAGVDFLVGPLDQLELVFALFDAVGSVVVSLPVAGVSQAFVDAVSARFPFVSVALDPSSGGVVLGGSPFDVVEVSKILVSRGVDDAVVRFDGVFFSYAADEVDRLEVALGLRFDLGDPGAGPFEITNRVGSGAPVSILVERLRSAGFVDLISRPSLTGVVGQRAVFRSGQQVPVRVGVDLENDVELFEYRDSGLTLSVDTSFVGDGLFRLVVTFSSSSVDGEGVLGNPIFSNRSVETVVDLRRGGTVFLSGLSELEASSSAGSSLFLPFRSGVSSDRRLGLLLTFR